MFHVRYSFHSYSISVRVEIEKIVSDRKLSTSKVEILLKESKSIVSSLYE